MAQSKEDIITDLRAAIDMQNALIVCLTDQVDYWKHEAIALLDINMRKALGLAEPEWKEKSNAKEQ
jgi:hypothetical protein